MYDRLLVPLDGSVSSLRGLHVAGALARRTGAAIEVVTVTAPGGDRAREAEKLAEEAQRALPDLRCTCTVMHAYDVAGILAALVDPATLLCMSTEGRAGVVRALFGSTADGVLRAIESPVLLVGPKAVEDLTPGVVQACVDVRSTSSRRAATVAFEIASWIGAGLALVEVQPTLAMHLAETAGEAAPLRWIAAELDDGRVPVEWSIAHGEDVAEELLRAAHLGGAQLLVVATRGHSGFARAVLGSVTSQLVDAATCPVIVVPASLTRGEEQRPRDRVQGP